MRFSKISGGFRVKRFQTIEAIPKRTKSFSREVIPYITENILIGIFAAISREIYAAIFREISAA